MWPPYIAKSSVQSIRCVKRASSATRMPWPDPPNRPNEIKRRLLSVIALHYDYTKMITRKNNNKYCSK